MHRHEFLRKLHAVYQPRTYHEIGVDDGRSLALSRVPTVAVDPAFKVVSELRCDLHLVRTTSDEFFARERPFEHLGDTPVDLAFIDGMHLFEYVIRDFINVERHARPTSVIVFDDQLPRDAREASRERHTGMWTGDVYKIIPVLQRYRPDLRLALMNTTPTGVMAVFGADPSSTVLSDRYDEIMEQFLLNDPQQLPDELATRSCAMEPEVLLDAPFWPTLRAAREDLDGPDGLENVRAEIDKVLHDAPGPDLGGWAPDPSVGRAEEVDLGACVGEAGMRAERRRKAAEAKAGAKKAKTAGGFGPPNDLYRKLAKRVPFLRRIPGARAVVHKLR